jgi:hypothetical protein
VVVDVETTDNNLPNVDDLSMETVAETVLVRVFS